MLCQLFGKFDLGVLMLRVEQSYHKERKIMLRLGNLLMPFAMPKPNGRS